MKKRVLSSILAGVLAVSVFAGCGSKTEDNSQAAADNSTTPATEAAAEESTEAAGGTVESKGTITVAASATPHAEILAAAKPILAEQGWDLEVTEFDDYVLPNEVVESGEMDANYFQHVPYLDSFNEEKGTHLVEVGKIHYEPFGIYPGTKSSLDDIADGDVIAVPNDTTNEARALLLLQDNGIITLKDGAGLEATVNDIAENPYNVEIQELAAESVARVADEVAYVVLNGNYALQAGFSVAKDALAYEKSDSEAAKTYVNVIVVKEGNENNEGVKALVDVLKSDEIKKFIAEQEMHADKRYIPEIVNHLGTGVDLPQKIAIVGGGPAGLSAAFYCRKMGYPVTVFEKESRPGGMLLNGIPSFRLEKNIIDAEIEVLRQMGVTFKCGVEVGKDVTIQQLREEGFKAFYVAIGAQGGRKAGVPGEDADGVKTGVEFLRSVNLDESTKLSGRTVVVGGGNVAVDVARAALRAGSGEVSMFCLESRDIMPAAKDEVAEAEEEGISVNNSWGPKEILTENGKVKAIVFKKCLSVKDADGRFNPQYDENDLMTVECENVLLSIGQSIVWGDLLKGTKVEIRPNAGAIADPVTYQTAEPDIFVGGDVYTGPRFAIDAIAAGKEGFVSMHRFVNPGQSLTLGRNRREFIELDKNNIDVETFDNAKRQIPGTKAGVAKETFRDLRCTLTEEQIKTEAKRCLGCGASVVDENKCIGCGICTTKCEFDAIHLTRDLPDASRMWKSEDKLKAIAPYALKRQFAINRNKN